MSWIGVDLDGTLAHYDEWRGVEHVGAPIAPMVRRVRRMLAAGVDVRIFTARVAGSDAEVAARVVRAWSREHIGRALPVTCKKDMGMVRLYDDRAVQVERNTGRLIGDARGDDR